MERIEQAIAAAHPWDAIRELRHLFERAARDRVGAAGGKMTLESNRLWAAVEEIDATFGENCARQTELEHDNAFAR